MTSLRPRAGSHPAAGAAAPAPAGTAAPALPEESCAPVDVERVERGGWLTARSARRGWMIGSVSSGGAWLLGAVGRAGLDGTPGGLLQLAHAVIFLAAYVAVPLISARVASRWRWPLAALVVLLFLPFPWALPSVAGWMVVYAVGAIVAQPHPTRAGVGVTLAGTVAAFALQVPVADGPTDLIGAPVLVLAIGLVFVSVQRQVEGQIRLRSAQAGLASAALEGERLRVARDVHDILGHSLTVITVKAQLAGRLIELDPARAATEIAELEALSRAALADVRATVTGFRSVTVVSELAASASALHAAGIVAELPTAADDVAEPARELFGWALREAVTNIVRHSRAQRCRVVLQPRRIRIEDDGVGPRDAGHGTAGSAASAGAGELARPAGNGLRGLAERADAVGATLTLGRSPLGGYLVEVSL
ncbi:histidine kinase [Tersicoccus sp. MR15.9]|uniref:sensor histidine kinase n=1 Tax=Tersicoccus mangrovi TaxID=3121635 RepID=UPI002FE592B1